MNTSTRIPLLFLASALGVACAGPRVDIAHETLYTSERPAGAPRLTAEQRRTAQLIQRGHYENMNRLLADLSIPGRDAAGKATTCALTSDFRLDDHPELADRFVGGHPVLKAQPVVFNAIQSAFMERLTACAKTMSFGPDAARELDERVYTLFLRNSGTPYCTLEQDCETFRWVHGDGEATLVNSRLTDPIFPITFRKFFPVVIAQLQASGDGRGSRRRRASEEPLPKTACVKNLCRLAAE